MRLKIDQIYINKAKSTDFLTEIDEHGHKQPQHIKFINIKWKPFSKFDFNPMYMVFTEADGGHIGNDVIYIKKGS